MRFESDSQMLPLNVMFIEEANSLHLKLEKALGGSVSTSESGRWTAITPNGWPNWQGIRHSTLALAGAARAVEAPVVEMVAATLDDVARRLDRFKAPVSHSGVQICREAVAILGREINAIASGTAGIEGSQALCIVDKLDAIAPR